MNGAILGGVPLCSTQHEQPYMAVLPTHWVMISLGSGAGDHRGQGYLIRVFRTHTLAYAQLPLFPSSPLAGDDKFGPVYLHAVLGPGPASRADAL